MRMLSTNILEGVLWLCSNTIRNRRGNNGIAPVHSRVCLGTWWFKLGFAPPIQERYSFGPSRYYVSTKHPDGYFVNRSQGYGIREREKNKTGMRIIGIVIKSWSWGYLYNLTLGFVKYHEANGIGMLTNGFTRILIRVGAGTIMGVHGSAIGYCSTRKKVSGSCPYHTEPMGSHT